jgi:hypothetical protein
VQANGRARSVAVVKSTNPADNAAAVEVAQTSHYSPGKHSGKPDKVTYYTYVLFFSGSGTTVDALDQAAQNDTLKQSTALLRAAKYDDAKALLTQYLRAAPD